MSATPPEASHSATVLVVEDDPAQARLVQMLLAAAGLSCIGTAASAERALELTPQAEIILLDYRLEGDRSGLDVLREIRSRGSAASVVVMTAHGSERVASEALHLGANDYIIKDEAFAHLLPDVLARVVRMREIERALAEAQQSLIKAERRAAIGEIVVALSHEINNPLMALSAQLDLMNLDASSLPQGSQAALALARSQVARIADLLRRLRELDREQATTYVGGTRMTDLNA
ncbi:MAG TPA: response regulator [Gemmatimonadales bacterium]|nr:response regulator [Gemmatimonadales bacterium]